MVTVFEQTATTAQDGAVAMCSGATVANQPQSSQMAVGGTSASSQVQVKIDSGQTRAGVMIQSAPNEPNLTTWPSGDWTVRINVTTGNSLVQWDDTYICRCNSSGVNQSTVASLTGQNIGLGTTGVKSMTVTQSSDESASATDEIYIVLVFQAGGSHSTQNWGITFDESIDQPSAAGGTRRIFIT